jgi:phosphoserine phosphatase
MTATTAPETKAPETKAPETKAPEMAAEILLMNVSGVDKPGLMAMVTSALAQYQVRVLDVGQAIIHDTLSLGFLIRVPPDQDAAAVQKELLYLGHDWGVPIRFSPVSPARYNDWVSSQGKGRHILTLLSAGITAAQLAAISSITRDHGLNIETVRRLSGRVPLESVDGATRTSVEMGLRGHPGDDAALKAALLEAAGRLNFDFSLQEDTVYRRNRRLVAFDMDSTLINVEVIDELAAMHGVGDRVASITERAMRGEIDFKTSFRERARLLRGLPRQALTDVIDRVQLNDGAERLIATLQHFGFKTAIISGGFQSVGEHLQAQLGIDHVYANTLEIVDGELTGEVVGDIVDAARKAELLALTAAEEGIALAQTIAIGDGANDLPMLNAAGLGVAYHAKPVVKESARHAISNFGLDSVLYLMGFTDADIEQTESTARRS